MKLELFHSIADADSAEVRRALVQKSLTEQVDFRNIAYESHAEALRKALETGVDESSGESARDGRVPTLVIDGQRVLRGKDEILAWLATK